MSIRSGTPTKMKLTKIQQKINTTRIEDVYEACLQSIDASGIFSPVKAGERVCIGLPSRGISAMKDMLRASIDALKEHGAEVFLVPAMGSHGGGTAAGQKVVLESYGFSESDLGVPIVSSMETVSLGEVTIPEHETSMKVVWDKHAAQADHVLVINRIKEHTAFSGRYESGLMKILSVGLGKAEGAKLIHAHDLQYAMPTAAGHILTTQSVLGGIAIVENGLHQAMVVEAVPAVKISTREPELLAMARETLPRIPFDSLDVLVIRKIGKDISGTGMDTNVIGKHRRNWGVAKPDYKRIVALDLTEASHGNATGVGFADVITQRLYDKIDLEATRLNCLTAGNFNGAKIPMVCENEEAAIDCALTGFDREHVRLVVIESTLDLETMWVSEALLGEVQEIVGVELIENI
ncbi:MAG: DUF362 domain-containing protein [Anaerolineaceae bacterium]|nr:DUF362 domain-containing protein [Anaerolineaceae bacterium]